MNGNGNMKASSWVVLECLIILAVLGGACFFVTPKYEAGVSIVLGAVIAVLNHQMGSVAGGKLPEQIGSPQPGQTSQTDTHTQSTEPAPAHLPPNPQSESLHNPQ
jgi:regulator of protease activity HflC (stomatin/prohibitin superfamily)